MNRKETTTGQSRQRAVHGKGRVGRSSFWISELKRAISMFSPQQKAHGVERQLSHLELDKHYSGRPWRPASVLQM